MVKPNLEPISVGRLGRAQVVFFEVDGVFTDGKTWQDESGQWRRSFSVRDTMGVRALRKAGLRVCVLTPVISSEIRKHFESVGVDVIKDHCLDEQAASAQILRAYGFQPDHAVFVCENETGEVEITSGNSTIYVASRLGGDGAVLEISNLVLQQRSSASTDASAVNLKVQGEL